MTIRRYLEIREVLGEEWCHRAVMTGILLTQLGWMTEEEYDDYWIMNKDWKDYKP